MSPRDHKIIAAVRDGHRVAEVARLHGLHPSMVHRILKREGVELPKQRSGPRPKAERFQLDGTTAVVAKRLSVWRDREGFDFCECDALAGLPRGRWYQAEARLWPLSLLELDRVAALMRTTVSALVG